VRSEMKWTILFFVHEKEVWEKRAEESRELGGHKAYALRQAAMWGNFAKEGRKKFKGWIVE